MATTAVGNCSAGTCPGGATSCYTVSITKKLPISLTALVGFQGTTTIGSQKAVLIAASATSQPGAAATGGGCMLALNKGNVTGFSVTGITTLTLNSCGLYDNATGSDAFDVSGIANITASAIDISGGKTISGIFTSTPTPTTGASATSDPYASDSVSVGSGCDQTNKVVNSNTTFTATGSTPYVFCGGLSAPGTATITLNPGILCHKNRKPFVDRHRHHPGHRRGDDLPDRRSGPCAVGDRYNKHRRTHHRSDRGTPRSGKMRPPVPAPISTFPAYRA